MQWSTFQKKLQGKIILLWNLKYEVSWHKIMGKIIEVPAETKEYPEEDQAQAQAQSIPGEETDPEAESDQEEEVKALLQLGRRIKVPITPINLKQRIM